MSAADPNPSESKAYLIRKRLYEKRYHAFWAFPLTGFLAATIFTGHFANGLFFAFIGFILSIRMMVKSGPEKASIYNANIFFDRALITLVATVLKADGKISEVEIRVVETKLKKEYFNRDFRRLSEILRAKLDIPKIDLEEDAAFVAENFSISEKIMLLHFLVRIAIADGMLTNAESAVLQQITSAIQIPYRTLDALLATHRFRTEQSQYQKPKVASFSQLENAYKILEIMPIASDQEVKKAYKKLAIIHHPDKVAHLGDHQQKAAAEKFKIIVGAYDLICKKRGIV